MRRLLVPLLLTCNAACGAGVPIQLRIDQLSFELSIDDGVAALSRSLTAGGLLPPESPGLPERWPAELPDICADFLITTDPNKGGRVDLTPDPVKDPGLAEQFKPINSGLVDRIELDDLVLRVEENTLNIALPPIEVQAADALDADPLDRRAWMTLGAIGGTSLSAGCSAPAGASADANQALEPGKLGDLPLEFALGGESFLDNQLADPDCLAHQQAAGSAADPLLCKELSVRARSRLVFDTHHSKDRPRGSARIRVIMVATFYVKGI